MSLFKKKISPLQYERAENAMKQLLESVDIVNTTKKPDVFFGRLHFSLELLLELQKHEKYGIFTGAQPSDDYRKLINQLETTVNCFIDRACHYEMEEISSLKTLKGKSNHAKKFQDKMISAFECANTFWSGDSFLPKYTGPLYTQTNLLYLKDALHQFELE